MARSEARIFTAVWKDKHFLALPLSAQWLYFFLVSQPDLSHCGVMPLRIRRWASKADGLTEEQIRTDLARLAEAQPNPFVVIDEESGELLVRSLMRRDKVLRQPFLFVPASEAIENVESPAIQAALLAELRRALAEGDVNDKVIEQVKSLVHTLGDRVQEWVSDTHPDTHSDTHTESLPASVSESVSETQQGIGGGYGPAVEASPIPGIPSVPPPAGTAAPRADPDRPINAGDVIAAYVDGATDAGMPRPTEKLRNKVGRDAKRLLAANGSDPAAVLAAARNMGAIGWSDIDTQIQRDAAAAKARASPDAGKYAPGSDPLLKPGTTYDPKKVI